ncbi:mitotic spindle assembly checkpoint protein MAD1-like isoform X2 [Sardina pilchardus]|uniref:mitotic spindle assembly checkpoint protein MAD1-like isoform X2 n=1 Tax=Sardina pilchardus TaxID=27697 RepID=UPI002E15561C
MLRVRAKMNEVSRHIDMRHKQACIDLEKATQYITQALQHEVGRNQELCMLIRRLEEKEAETGRSLTEQVVSNKQLKLKINELQKHLEEKDHSLTQANQTVAFLKNELRDLHQHLQSQPSNRTAQEVNEWPEDVESQIKPIRSLSSPLQSEQLTAAEEPLVWSEQLKSSDDQIPLVSSDGQIPLVSSDGQIPPASSDGQIPLVCERRKKIKDENAAPGYELCSQSERADPRVECTVPSPADIKFEQIQTLLVTSDGQRLLEAPVSEDEEDDGGDDEEYGEYSHSERADPRVEYTVPSPEDMKVEQIQMLLSSKEKNARLQMRLSNKEKTARFRAKIRADPAARAASLAKRRERDSEVDMAPKKGGAKAQGAPAAKAKTLKRAKAQGHPEDQAIAPKKASTLDPTSGSAAPSSSSPASNTAPPPCSSTATSAHLWSTEDETTFHSVLSLLRTCSGHRLVRYPITVEELRRRTSPPESMSLHTVTALLRTNKNLKRELRQQLREMGVTPSPATRVTSLCSKLSEGEAKDLCSSLWEMAARGIDFDDISMLPASSLTMATGRAVEFKEQLQHLATQIAQSNDFTLLTHNLGPGMVQVVAEIMVKCVDSCIAKF